MENTAEFGPNLPNKEDVITVAKREGATEKEISATLNLWQANKEKEADESAESLPRIKLNLELADLFLIINRIADARTYQELAREMISNEMHAHGDPLPPEFEELNLLCGDLHYEIQDEEDKLTK
jgi:hypothetical protein